MSRRNCGHAILMLGICACTAAWSDADGPDFFSVTPGMGTELRAGPSDTDASVGQLPAGAVVRNLGCQGEGEARWCRVGTLEGWVRASDLAEAAVHSVAGEGKTLSSGDGAGIPSVYQRGTGEYEVNFRGGCGALFDAQGRRITAGSSCSATQLEAAATAVSAALNP